MRASPRTSPSVREGGSSSSPHQARKGSRGGLAINWATKSDLQIWLPRKLFGRPAHTLLTADSADSADC